jgi:hypothetical protein
MAFKAISQRHLLTKKGEKRLPEPFPRKALRIRLSPRAAPLPYFVSRQSQTQVPEPSFVNFVYFVTFSRGLLIARYRL